MDRFYVRLLVILSFLVFWSVGSELLVHPEEPHDAAFLVCRVWTDCDFDNASEFAVAVLAVGYHASIWLRTLSEYSWSSPACLVSVSSRSGLRKQMRRSTEAWFASRWTGEACGLSRRFCLLFQLLHRRQKGLSGCPVDVMCSRPL